VNIDRRLIRNFDWTVLVTVLVLSLTGIMTIFSATRPLPGAEQPSYYIKQMYWLLLGLAFMVIVVSVDYKWLNRAAYYLYGAGIFLLVLVFIIGKTGLGAQRWLSIGPLSFQPSEFFKVAMIIALSRYMSLRVKKLSLRNIGFAFILFVLPALLLLLKQPDLGTTVVVFIMFVLMVLTKGVDRRIIALVVIIALVSIPFVGSIVWDELKDYQKKRIVAFIKPDLDPDGISYHVTQSKVAVGSGGFWGKGYLKGTQGPFRFLPEKHTDFVFSIFAEEWGFWGSMLLLVIYIVLITRGLNTARKSKDDFGMLLALGITFMFSFYCFVNIGMTLGLMPVVGIPLPFMSYGGTALVSNLIAAGILINIRARRFELFY
jgi:rod shape determining protein RodA